MNNVSLIGRLTADPELKHAQSEKAFTRFTVAVDRPTKQGEEKQADFINCTAWGKTAEFVSKYFTKGQRIALTGTIRTGNFTDKDGNKRYTFDVWVSNVEFCESKKQGQAATAATTEQSNSGSTDIAVENIHTDDDLPF